MVSHKSYHSQEATKPMQVPQENGHPSRHSTKSAGGRTPTLIEGIKNMNILAIGVKRGIHHLMWKAALQALPIRREYMFSPFPSR